MLAEMSMVLGDPILLFCSFRFSHGCWKYPRCKLHINYPDDSVQSQLDEEMCIEEADKNQ